MEISLLKPWPWWLSVFLLLALLYTLFYKPRTMPFGKLIFAQGKVGGRSKINITKSWLSFLGCGVCFLLSLSSPYLTITKDSPDILPYAVPVSEEEYLVYDAAARSLYTTSSPPQSQVVSSSLPDSWHQVVLSVWPNAMKEKKSGYFVVVDGVRLSLDHLDYDWSISPSNKEVESFARWLLLSITPEGVSREEVIRLDMSPFFAFFAILLGSLSVFFTYRSHKNY